MFSKNDAIIYSKAFLKECDNLPVKISRAILFGSSAKNLMNDDSDIDIALFSDNFSDNILKNLDIIGKAAIKFPEIDLHTFPSKSYKGKSLMMDEIKRTGIELK
jgi:predicted nucleotidyltransferase